MKKLKHLIIFVVAVVTCWKIIEANPFGFVPYVEPTQGSVNLSQANVNNAQAAQTWQAIRRQDEMDNGLSVNMIARVISGHGITDFEKFASVIFSLLVACGLAPGLLALAVIILIKLTKSSNTEV